MTDTIARVEAVLAAAETDALGHYKARHLQWNTYPEALAVVRAAGGHAHEFGQATPCDLCDAVAAYLAEAQEYVP